LPERIYRQKEEALYELETFMTKVLPNLEPWTANKITVADPV